METESIWNSKKSQNFLLLFFMILKIAMGYLFVNSDFELHRDEFLYLDQGNHLAWGYHAVPPFSSWISFICLKLGKHEMLVRFFPSLFGALTLALVWKTTSYLKGNLYAHLLVAFALTFSSMLRINMLFQPNSFDILCWTAIYFCLIRFFQTQKPRWLFALAIVAALGFLNKYNILFCLAGLLPALAALNSRKIFGNKLFYAAIACGILLILPNLLWQFNHNFPVIRHMKELQETQLVHNSRLDFLKEQLLFFLSALPIFIASIVALSRHEAFKPFRFLILAYLFTIGLFVFLNGKGYYAIGLYPIFFAFGATYIEKITATGWKQKLKIIPFLIIAVLFVPMINRSMPLKPIREYAQGNNTHTWEDGKKHPISQDFADMVSWKELARKIDSIYLTVKDKKKTFILCDGYGLTGAINYYTKIPNLKANSFTDDYLFWTEVNPTIETIIRVKEKKNLNNNQELMLFDNVTIADEITNPYAREKGTQILLLSQPKIDIAGILLKEQKKQIENIQKRGE